MFLSVIEFPSNFEYGGDVISSVGWLKMLEVPSHYVYNFNSASKASLTNLFFLENFLFVFSGKLETLWEKFVFDNL